MSKTMGVERFSDPLDFVSAEEDRITAKTDKTIVNPFTDETISVENVNCGIGPGGFQPGNTCGKGGGGGGGKGGVGRGQATPGPIVLKSRTKESEANFRGAEGPRNKPPTKSWDEMN